MQQSRARRGGVWFGGIALIAALAFVAKGCTQGPAAPSSQESAFDSKRAWNDLEQLVAIGTRQSGTPGAEKTRAYFEKELTAAGAKPIREEFKQMTPAGELQFANVYVDFPPANESATSPWILICTHYDTKRLPGEFVGANDAGSGSAVLLELARALARAPRGKFGYRLLFLDGEEAVNPVWVDPDNRYGSRYHAKKLKDSGRAAHFKACVLLDMVGDKDLELLQEAFSDGKIYGVFTDAARELGLGSVVTTKRGGEVIDDHRIFMEANIRSVDLIDFNYGPNNSWWHTLDDKLENCSEKSLGIVGRVVLRALPALEKHLLGG